MGIWAWPELLTLRDEASADIMKWLVLDVEGFFASDSLNGRSNDPDYYARLFGIATLLSSVVVYFDHIERSVSSRDLDVFRDIALKIQEFRRASPGLKAAMTQNQRPFSFVVRDWKSTPLNEWAHVSDAAYWAQLDGICAFTEFINLFADPFQFNTLPTFNGRSEPENLSYAHATEPYRKRFKHLMRVLLTPQRATSNLSVDGVAFGGCGYALEAQLDTVVEAYSTSGIDISARSLRKRLAEWNIMRVYHAVEDELKASFDRAARDVNQQIFLMNVDQLQDELDQIVANATFNADELAEVDPRNPRDELRSIVSNLVLKVRDALTLEVERILSAIKVERAIDLDSPEDFLRIKLQEIPEALRDKVRSVVERRLDEKVVEVERFTWNETEKLLVGTLADPDRAERIDNCTMALRLTILQRMHDLTSVARQYMDKQKPWLQVSLKHRFDQFRQELIKSLQSHAQDVADSAIQQCFAVADLGKQVRRPTTTVTLQTADDTANIDPRVTLVFNTKYLPINDLHLAAFKTVKCASNAVADELWVAVWKAVVDKFLSLVESMRPPFVLYAYVRVRQEADVLRYVQPFEAVEAHHVVDAEDSHIVAIILNSETEAFKASRLQGIANVELREPMLHFAEVELAGDALNFPTREQIQRSSDNALVLHAIQIGSTTIAVFYTNKSREEIPCFDAKWIAGMRVTFYEPLRLSGAAESPPAAGTTVLRLQGGTMLVYSPKHRVEVKPDEHRRIVEYDEVWYADPIRFSELHRDRASDFKHKRFCQSKWTKALEAASRECPPERRWCDPVLCGLRNLVLRGTIAALTVGCYYVLNGSHTTKVLLPATAPAVEIINTSELRDLVPPHASKAIRVQVVTGDTLDVASRYALKGAKPLVLNMANTNTFGGGYLHGRAAQEEDLFRRTTYHLLQTEAQKQYPMKPYDVHIAKNVAVFREGEREGYRFFDDGQKIFHLDFIGAAAFDLNNNNYKNQAILPPTPDNEPLALTTQLENPNHATVTPFWMVATARKIRGILHAAASRGYKVLVLGALGTGAFCNPVDKIIELFKIELDKYCAYFDEVVFAIHDYTKAGQFERGLAADLRCPGTRLSIAKNVCPYGGLCLAQDDEAHCDQWTHPQRCEECTTQPQSRSDVHRVCFSHKLKCKFWSICPRINDESHTAKYLHAPRCHVADCSDESVQHNANLSHLPLCDQCLDCPHRMEADHASTFRHLQAKCEFGVHCRAFLDPMHMSSKAHPFAPPCPNLFACHDDSPSHLNALSHLCAQGEHCSKITDREHVKNRLHLMGHACPDGANCLRRLDEEHLDTFSHPGIFDIRGSCADGADCARRADAEHVALYSHQERKLAPSVGKAARAVELIQGGKSAVHHADRRVPFDDNATNLAAAIRSHWSHAPSDNDAGLVEASNWVHGFVPVHRCKPVVFSAITSLGALVSKDEIDMVADKTKFKVAVRRFTKIHPVLAMIMQQFPNQTEVIQHYATTTVSLAIQSVRPPTPPVPKPPSTAAPQPPTPRAAPTTVDDLKHLETEQHEANLALTTQLPTVELEKVVDAVQDIKSACVALSTKVDGLGGIGYEVDRIVGTDNTVFSIVGPHTGDYGEVRLVLRREVMHLFNFFMLPCAATFFNRQNFTNKLQRPWAGTNNAAWEPEGKEALLKSKFHASTPSWSKTLALDIGARGKTAAAKYLDGVKGYYKTMDSHCVIEGHLPQSLSLEYVLKAILKESTFNDMTPADQARIRATFGDRLVLCPDDDTVVNSVDACFGNVRSMDRPRRGFITSLLADPKLEVPIPVTRKPKSTFHLAFRFRAASLAIVLSNRNADDQPQDVRQFCIFFEAGRVTIADSPAHAMSGDPMKVLITRPNFFHENSSATFLHVCITVDDKSIVISKWGPTEVRNPNGRFVTTTPGNAKILDSLKYASMIATSAVEILDCELLPCAPPSVIQPFRPVPRAASTAAPALRATTTRAAVPRVTPASSPCGAALGCCAAYTGDMDAKKQHHQQYQGQPHRCFRGPSCREINDPEHSALFRHDIVTIQCDDGPACPLRFDPQHRADFSHPEMWDVMIQCRNGSQCTQRHQERHKRDYFHPRASDSI